MKHFFIVNPAAGQGDGVEKLKSALAKTSLHCEVYETKCRGDATEYVKACVASTNEELRFYACGGDGTAKEVAEGIIGAAHASMTIYPIGSGNDLVKYFGGADKFMDIVALAEAPVTEIDIIHVTTKEGMDTYSINAINFGFEAVAAAVMNKVRRKPIIGGKASYTTGVVGAIFTAMKNKGEIYADGELLNPDGTYILCTAANGGFIGGGYHCAPRASVADGLLEVCKMRPLSIFTLVRLIGVYKAGKHLEDKRFEKYITYCRVKKIESSSEKPFSLSLDGEVTTTTHFTAEVMPKAIRFAAPK